MTYTEREIARLEGVKDGLIKKLVDECEEINDQIIALRKGKPRKKDSEIYFDRGYAKGVQDTISTIKEFTKDWNKQSNKRVPYFAIDELIEYITEKEQKNGQV